MATIPLCGYCGDRRAEVRLVGVTDDRPDVPSLHLCFDCLRSHPEFRFFKTLMGCRKPPKDLTQRRVEEAKALREQGLTYDAIGKRFSVSHTVILTWLNPRTAESSTRAARKWYANSDGARQRIERRRAYVAEHPLYTAWTAMKHRCYAPQSQGYADYGGRGIRLHPSWENNFEAFEAWIYANLGPRPEGRTLDRIDNDGNYEPGNVRWATHSQQRMNKRPYIKNSVADKLRAQLRAAGLEPCA